MYVGDMPPVSDVVVSLANLVLSQWGSEAKLGALEAPARFTIHTKAPGLITGGLSRTSIEKAMEQSLRELGADSVCVLAALRRSVARS